MPTLAKELLSPLPKCQRVACLGLDALGQQDNFQGGSGVTVYFDLTNLTFTTIQDQTKAWLFQTLDICST